MVAAHTEVHVLDGEMCTSTQSQSHPSSYSDTIHTRPPPSDCQLPQRPRLHHILLLRIWIPAMTCLAWTRRPWPKSSTCAARRRRPVVLSRSTPPNVSVAGASGATCRRRDSTPSRSSTSSRESRWWTSVRLCATRRPSRSSPSSHPTGLAASASFVLVRDRDRPDNLPLLLPLNLPTTDPTIAGHTLKKKEGGGWMMDLSKQRDGAVQNVQP